MTDFFFFLHRSACILTQYSTPFNLKLKSVSSVSINETFPSFLDPVINICVCVCEILYASATNVLIDGECRKDPDHNIMSKRRMRQISQIMTQLINRKCCNLHWRFGCSFVVGCCFLFVVVLFVVCCCCCFLLLLFVFVVVCFCCCCCCCFLDVCVFCFVLFVLCGFLWFLCLWVVFFVCLFFFGGRGGGGNILVRQDHRMNPPLQHLLKCFIISNKIVV